MSQSVNDDVSTVVSRRPVPRASGGASGRILSAAIPRSALEAEPDDSDEEMSQITFMGEESIVTGRGDVDSEESGSRAGDLPAAGGEAEAFEVTADSDVRGGPTARYYVFTIQCEDLQSPARHLVRQSWAPPVVGGKIKYIVCQREIGAETGRLHWQGYVQMTSPQRAAAVRKALACDWAWVKPARGTPEQARAYCTKEETRVDGSVPHESGSLTNEQGKRNDLADAMALVKSGARTVKVLEAHPATFARYHRGLQVAAHVWRTEVAQTTDRVDLEVIVVFGPPGTGKTRWVFDTTDRTDMYTLTVGTSATVWWDGYDGQNTVLIDDFAGQIPFRSLLNFLDIYPVQCPVKGSMVWLSARRIVLTSNLHWSEWYQADPAGRRDLAALRRRITEVRHVSAFGAEHTVHRRGTPASDPTNWVPLPIPDAYAPGFTPP